MAKRFGLLALMILGGVLVVTPALAEDTGDAESSESSKSTDSGSGDEKAADDAEPKEEKEAEGDKSKKPPVDPAVDDSSSPVEDAGKTYMFLGARYRMIIVPKFIIGMFADGGDTVIVHSGGPELGVRKAGFEFNVSTWLAAYSMDPTPFKAHSDGESAWELVSSNIKVLNLTLDLLWSHSFNPEFALNYGMGAGLGVVWGPLHRNQAYRTNGGFAKCAGVNNPSNFCGSDNNHYGNYTEPSWLDGGSKPIVFPWLAVQTGLRYKPHKKFVARLDTGFGLTGFFVGLGADYGL
ncbi:MAG: hypothetical protein QM756_19285 [Polyangiaceae bacterium]